MATKKFIGYFTKDDSDYFDECFCNTLQEAFCILISNNITKSSKLVSIETEEKELFNVIDITQINIIKI